MKDKGLRILAIASTLAIFAAGFILMNGDDATNLYQPNDFSYNASGTLRGNIVDILLYRYDNTERTDLGGYYWNLHFPDYYFYYKSHTKGGIEKFVTIHVYGEEFQAVNERRIEIENMDIEQDQKSKLHSDFFSESFFIQVYSNLSHPGMKTSNISRNRYHFIGQFCSLNAFSKRDISTYELGSFGGDQGPETIPRPHHKVEFTNIDFDQFDNISQSNTELYDNDFYFSKCTLSSISSHCRVLSFYEGWEFSWYTDLDGVCNWRENKQAVLDFLLEHTVAISSINGAVNIHDEP